jgi:hypothetical protein
MRSRALLIALLIGLAAVLACGAGSRALARAATPADGQPLKKPQQPPPPPPRAAVKPLKAKPARLPAAFAPPKASPIPPDASQCRQACAHAYYFCLAGGEADSCPGPWTSCLSDCSRGVARP